MFIIYQHHTKYRHKKCVWNKAFLLGPTCLFTLEFTWRSYIREIYSEISNAKFLDCDDQRPEVLKDLL